MFVENIVVYCERLCLTLVWSGGLVMCSITLRVVLGVYYRVIA